MSGVSVQAGQMHGALHIHTGPPVPALLHQLPAIPRHFVNRRRELDHIARTITTARPGEGGTVFQISGLAGVGKTATAARALRDADVEGHLYADLRGFSSHEASDPRDVLTVFLTALSVPPETIPGDLASLAAWFRSATTGRRLGILLDNAVSAAQARSLLPGAGAHVVVVTSRHRLTGLALDGAHFVALRPLERADTTELLTRLSGAPFTPTEQVHADRVAELCAGLPIAVNAVAVQAAEGRPLRGMAQQLGDGHRRLAALSDTDGATSVRAAFDLSYDALGTEEALTYRRLGWHPGPDITVLAARTLTQRTREECERDLRGLASASLLTEVDGGRYRFHDLIRLHAQSTADLHEDPTARTNAMVRLLQTYSDRALAADGELRPFVAGRGADHSVFPHARAALTWLEEERDTLVALADYAAGTGRAAYAAGIAEGLWPLYLKRRQATAWLRAGEAALGVAGNDGFQRAHLLNNKGSVLGFLGRIDEAEAAFDQAQRIWAQRDDQARLAQTYQRRGLLALNTNRASQALPQLEEALRLDEACDRPSPRNLARTLLALGRAHTVTGHPNRAEPLLRRALILTEGGHDSHTRARVRAALGRITMGTDPAGAQDHLDHAHAAMVDLDHSVGQAETLEALGDLAAHRGDVPQARRHYQSALGLTLRLNAHEAHNRIRNRLRLQR